MNSNDVPHLNLVICPSRQSAERCDADSDFAIALKVRADLIPTDVQDKLFGVPGAEVVLPELTSVDRDLGSRPNITLRLFSRVGDQRARPAQLTRLLVHARVKVVKVVRPPQGGEPSAHLQILQGVVAVGPLDPNDPLSRLVWNYAPGASGRGRGPKEGVTAVLFGRDTVQIETALPPAQAARPAADGSRCRRLRWLDAIGTANGIFWELVCSTDPVFAAGQPWRPVDVINGVVGRLLGILCAPTLAPGQAGTGGQLAAGVYSYVVTSTVGQGGESAPSNEVSVTTLPGGQVTLTWSPPADAAGISGYAVYRTDAAGRTVRLIPQGGAATTTFTDSDPNAGTAGTPPGYPVTIRGLGAGASNRVIYCNKPGDGTTDEILSPALKLAVNNPDGSMTSWLPASLRVGDYASGTEYTLSDQDPTLVSSAGAHGPEQLLLQIAWVRAADPSVYCAAVRRFDGVLALLDSTSRQANDGGTLWQYTASVINPAPPDLGLAAKVAGAWLRHNLTDAPGLRLSAQRAPVAVDQSVSLAVPDGPIGVVLSAPDARPAMTTNWQMIIEAGAGPTPRVPLSFTVRLTDQGIDPGAEDSSFSFALEADLGSTDVTAQSPQFPAWDRALADPGGVPAALVFDPTRSTQAPPAAPARLGRRPPLRPQDVPAPAAGADFAAASLRFYGAAGKLLPPTLVSATVKGGGQLPLGTAFYAVTALTGSGESPASNELAVEVTGANRTVTLTWSPPTSGASRVKEYRIYRGTGAGEESLLVRKVTDANTTSYDDPGGPGVQATPPLTFPGLYAVPVAASMQLRVQADRDTRPALALYRPFGQALVRPVSPAGGNAGPAAGDAAPAAAFDPTRGLLGMVLTGAVSLEFPDDTSCLGKVTCDVTGVQDGAGVLALFPWGEVQWSLDPVARTVTNLPVPYKAPPSPNPLTVDCHHRNLLLESEEFARGIARDTDVQKTPPARYADTDVARLTRDRFSRMGRLADGTVLVDNWLPGSTVSPGGLPKLSFTARDAEGRASLSATYQVAVPRGPAVEQTDVLRPLYRNDQPGGFLSTGVEWARADDRQPPELVLTEDGGASAANSAVPVLLWMGQTPRSYDNLGVVRPATPSTIPAAPGTVVEQLWAPPDDQGQPVPVLSLTSTMSYAGPDAGADVAFWCHDLKLQASALLGEDWYEPLPLSGAGDAGTDCRMGSLGSYSLFRQSKKGHAGAFDGRGWPEIAGVPVVPIALVGLKWNASTYTVDAVRFLAVLPCPRDVLGDDAGALPGWVATAASGNAYVDCTVTASDITLDPASSVFWSFGPEDANPGGDGIASLRGTVTYDRSKLSVTNAQATVAALGAVWPATRVDDLTGSADADSFSFATPHVSSEGSLKVSSKVSTNAEDYRPLFTLSAELTLMRAHDGDPVTKLVATVQHMKRQHPEADVELTALDVVLGSGGVIPALECARWENLHLFIFGDAKGALTLWIEQAADGNDPALIGWALVVDQAAPNASVMLEGLPLTGVFNGMEVDSSMYGKHLFGNWLVSGQFQYPECTDAVRLLITSRLIISGAGSPPVERPGFFGQLEIQRSWTPPPVPSAVTDTFHGTVLLSPGQGRVLPSELTLRLAPSVIYDAVPATLLDAADVAAVDVIIPVPGRPTLTVDVKRLAAADCCAPTAAGGACDPALAPRFGRIGVGWAPAWTGTAPLTADPTTLALRLEFSPDLRNLSLTQGVSEQSMLAAGGSWRPWLDATNTPTTPVGIDPLYDVRWTSDARMVATDGQALYVDSTAAAPPLKVTKIAPVAGQADTLFGITPGMLADQLSRLQVTDGGAPSVTVQDHVVIRGPRSEWLALERVQFWTTTADPQPSEGVIGIGKGLAPKRIMALESDLAGSFREDSPDTFIGGCAAVSASKGSYVAFAVRPWLGEHPYHVELFLPQIGSDHGPVLKPYLSLTDVFPGTPPSLALIEFGSDIILAIAHPQAESTSLYKIRPDALKGAAPAEPPPPYEELPAAHAVALGVFNPTQGAGGAVLVVATGRVRDPSTDQIIDVSVYANHLGFLPIDAGRLPIDRCSDTGLVQTAAWRGVAEPQLCHLQGDGPRLMNPPDASFADVPLLGAESYIPPPGPLGQQWLLSPVLVGPDGAAIFRENLALADAPAGSVAPSPGGATESGTTVTIITTSPLALAVGDSVTITGVAVAGYNGTFTVTGVNSATSFTYTNPTTGLAASGGGTVKVALVLRTDTLLCVSRAEPFGPLYNQTTVVPPNTRSADVDDQVRRSLVAALGALGWQGPAVWRTLDNAGAVSYQPLAVPATATSSPYAFEARRQAAAGVAFAPGPTAVDARLVPARVASHAPASAAANAYHYHPVNQADLEADQSAPLGPGGTAPARRLALRLENLDPAADLVPTLSLQAAGAYAGAPSTWFLPDADSAAPHRGDPDAPPPASFLPRDLLLTYGPSKPGGMLFHNLQPIAADGSGKVLAPPPTILALRDPQVFPAAGEGVTIQAATWRTKMPVGPDSSLLEFSLTWQDALNSVAVSDSDDLPLWDAGSALITYSDRQGFRLPENKRIFATVVLAGRGLLEAPEYAKDNGGFSVTKDADIPLDLQDAGPGPAGTTMPLPVWFVVSRLATLTEPVPVMTPGNGSTTVTFDPFLSISYLDPKSKQAASCEVLLSQVLPDQTRTSLTCTVLGAPRTYYIWQLDFSNVSVPLPSPDVWKNAVLVNVYWKQRGNLRQGSDPVTRSPWDPAGVRCRPVRTANRPQTSVVAQLEDGTRYYDATLAHGLGADTNPPQATLECGATGLVLRLDAVSKLTVDAPFPVPSAMAGAIRLYVIKTDSEGQVIGDSILGTRG